MMVEGAHLQTLVLNAPFLSNRGMKHCPKSSLRAVIYFTRIQGRACKHRQQFSDSVPKLAEVEPIAVDVGGLPAPKLSKFGTGSTELCQIWPESSQIWADVGRFGATYALESATVDQMWPMSTVRGEVEHVQRHALHARPKKVGRCLSSRYEFCQFRSEIGQSNTEFGRLSQLARIRPSWARFRLKPGSTRPSVCRIRTACDGLDRNAVEAQN